MSYSHKRRRIKVWYIPREARTVARQFQREAEKARQLAHEIRSLQQSLETKWLGSSSNKFQNMSPSVVSELERYADQIEDAANRIQKIECYQYEYV